MNTLILRWAPLSLVLVASLPAQTPEAAQPGVPVSAAAPNTTLYTPPAGEDQRVYGERQSSLITQEAERAITERFRAMYGQGASPRLVVYVNRNLATPDSGLRLAGRTDKTVETSTPADAAAPKTTTASSESSYTAVEVTPPPLADRMTVREIERIFGRVFRVAGAKLADASVAASLLADEPGVRLEGDKAAKERAALAKVADIAIEVLISSRNLTITRISGDYTYEVPDIQVTAIRLSDAVIVGQAAASDVIGHAEHAVRIARQFAVTDITEATVFALMQDMLATGAK